tara:strand:+ start:22886 stop:24736 length:1851 start_codon:yes stop_codon:yes gene_type:complete
MKNLYILQAIEEGHIVKLNENDADFICFDYTSHMILTSKEISHKLLDDFLKDKTREGVFKKCREYLEELEITDNRQLEFHNVNLINIIDRNELLEFLMDIMPKVSALRIILKNTRYNKVFLPSSLYEFFSKTNLAQNFELFNKEKNNKLTFEKIQIPIKIGELSSNFTISRQKYQFVKKIMEKLAINTFNLGKNDNKRKNLILIEFDPETYSDLLTEIHNHGLQPVLVNFRKSAIYSKKTLSHLRQTNSIVITLENFVEKNEQIEIKNEKTILLEILEKNHFENNLIPSFFYEEIDLTHHLKKKIVEILFQRIEEYLNCIFIAHKMSKSRENIGIIMLNNSGETEKIFSRIFPNSLIFLLQHAFANYTKSISFFDILDDYHSRENKFMVWGNTVREYLLNVKKIPNQQITMVGSPKYDSFLSRNSSKHAKKILVTLRPIINHMEGLRINLFDRYRKVIFELVNFSKKHPDAEIIFKLHPQQNISNDFIIDIVKKHSKMKISQSESVKELLMECDLQINIATDNFDASSVILEGMLLKKPILNIALQKNQIEFDFIKFNAIKNINYDSDIEGNILNLFQKDEIEKMIKNSGMFLEEYLVNHGCASRVLVDSIIESNK